MAILTIGTKDYNNAYEPLLPIKASRRKLLYIDRAVFCDLLFFFELFLGSFSPIRARIPIGLAGLAASRPSRPMEHMLATNYCL